MGRLGRSYAEVVREGVYASHLGPATRLELQDPSLTTHHHRKVPFTSPTSSLQSNFAVEQAPSERHSSPWPARESKARRRREVLFTNSPTVVFFHKDAAPASIRHLSSLQSQCKPRSCLKQPKVLVPKIIARAEPWESCIKLMDAEIAPCDSREYAQASVGKFQEEPNQSPWQPVKERHWWRKLKAKTIFTSSPARHQNSAKFKEKVGDRCYNCLARGHKVVHCRDPPRCWRCGGNGHISFRCSISHSRSQGVHGGRTGRKSASARDSAIDGDQRRPSSHNIIHRGLYWIDDKTKDESHIPKLFCDGGPYREESSRRRQLKEKCSSASRLETNKPIEEIKTLKGWRSSKEQHTNKKYYSEETIQVGLQKNEYQINAQMRCNSDAIIIVPQEHSPTTQQLEAWLGTVARSREKTSPPQMAIRGSDDTSNSSVVHAPHIASPRLEMTNLKSTNVLAEMKAWTQLWESQCTDRNASKDHNAAVKIITNIGEQFDREVVPYSDAIHIIPLLSFSEEHQKIDKEEVPGNKHTENMTRYEQKSDVIGLPSITASQQPIMLDELHLDNLNVRMPFSKSKIDQPMAKTHTAQEIETEEAPTFQKQPFEPELVTESNLASMLKKFKEAVTKPLEPCLLKTPSSKLIDKEEKNEEQKPSSGLKIKQKKQRITNKMARETLTTSLSILGSEMAMDGLTLQQYLDTKKKPMSSSALESCKNLTEVVGRKTKHKKKLSVGAKIVKKRKKSSKVD